MSEPTITFYHKYPYGGQDKAAMEPIAQKAQDQGFSVEFTTDYSTDAKIGIYARNRDTINADLSVIMFHGIDDAYRAGYWQSHDWSLFDIGLLPGEYAVKQWQKQAHLVEANPKLGMYDVGWPKADQLYTAKMDADQRRLQDRFDINDDDRVVLYAPTSEDHGKIHDCVSACTPVTDHLLIKHAPYEELEYNDRYDSLAELYTEYEHHEGVYIIDQQESILPSLLLADIVVSDQSSVLNEALLTDTIPVSVQDWQVRSGTTVAEKEYQLPFTEQPTQSNLQEKIDVIYEQYNQRRTALRRQREQHFSHLGDSADIVIALISAYIMDGIMPIESTDPAFNYPSLTEEYMNGMRALKRFRTMTVENLPTWVETALTTVGVDELEKTAKDQIEATRRRLLGR